MNIFLIYLIQFCSNSARNLLHLTSHVRHVDPQDGDRDVTTDYCDATLPYVY